jgi:DNA-directed RNA polymerase specialized sigma24 family protein
LGELEEHLQQLIMVACQHSPGSLERAKILTHIIRLVSPQLWREESPYYPDALQETWLYFCRNICERGTAEPYDPDRANLSTWLNAYLRFRLRNHYLQQQERMSKQSEPTLERATFTSEIDKAVGDYEIPPILEEVKAWAEAEAAEELTAIHVRNRPDVTAQLLILKRLPPEVGWKQLSEDLNLSVSTLSSFYQRKCFPLLRNFAKSRGYL